MSFDFMSKADFESLPVNRPVPPGDAFWNPIIAALEEGKIVKIPFGSEKEKKGRRLAAGRRASKAGFRIELRYGPDFVAIRRR